MKAIRWYTYMQSLWRSNRKQSRGMIISSIYEDLIENNLEV